MLLLQLLVIHGALANTESNDRMGCLMTQSEVKYPNGSSYCQNCLVCPPGKEPSHLCGEIILAKDFAKVRCHSCIDGKTFSSSNNPFPCATCTKPWACPTGQVVLQNCSVTGDQKCDDEKCGKGKYYENRTGHCEECSRCCGNKRPFDVKEECMQGGLGRDQSCSVYYKHSCQSTTVKTTDGEKGTIPWSATTATATVPTSPQAATNTTELTSTMLTHSTAIGKSAATQRPKTTVATDVVIVFAVIAFISVVVVALCRIKSCNRPCKRDPLNGTEQGLDDRKDGQSSYSTKSDSLKVLIPMHSDMARDQRPLMVASANAGHHSIDERITLKEFSDKNYIAFDHVCQLLDISIPGCGNYEQVAKHYGVLDCTIQSRFKTYEEGPSKALFGWLGGKDPKLMLGDFFAVLRKINRIDVVELFENVHTLVYTGSTSQ